jgi:putative transposase
MARLWKGSHTRHRLQIHIVWIPKYRKRILKGKIAVRLRQLLYQACKMNRWWIGQLAVQEDHVHAMIQIKPNESVSQVVQILKGGSSRVIRSEFPELEEFLWGESLWADGYFAETVGQVEESVVSKYIREQRK